MVWTVHQRHDGLHCEVLRPLISNSQLCIFGHSELPDPKILALYYNFGGYRTMLEGRGECTREKTDFGPSSPRLSLVPSGNEGLTWVINNET